MTAPDPFADVRARNKLVDRVRAALSGTGLDVRDRASALVISRPGYPDSGRIYITYTTGEVSLSRPVWRYLGRLEGHQHDGDPDAEPAVDAAAIVAALTGPAGTSAEDAGACGPEAVSPQASPEPDEI
ncbi:MAG TPA: hypothetical protein VKV02_00245 [Acidobacteriaceae bacterium]|nr:hypothetical protein [Acidobacteriaceae bacterium]